MDHLWVRRRRPLGLVSHLPRHRRRHGVAHGLERDLHQGLGELARPRGQQRRVCQNGGRRRDGERRGRRLGDGRQHHFFGYYNKSSWDRSNRLVLAQQTPWMDQYLTPQARASIGYFDTENGDRFHAVGKQYVVKDGDIIEFKFNR